MTWLIILHLSCIGGARHAIELRVSAGDFLSDHPSMLPLEVSRAPRVVGVSDPFTCISWSRRCYLDNLEER